MHLSTPSSSIQISKAAVTTTTDPDFVCAFTDLGIEGRVFSGEQVAALPGTSLVQVIDPPPDRRLTRNVLYMGIHNRDSVQHTFTVAHVSADTRRLIQLTLATLESADYTPGHGWRVYTSAGVVK